MLRNGSSDENSPAETSSRKGAAAFTNGYGPSETESIAEASATSQTGRSSPCAPGRANGDDANDDANMASLIEDEIIPKLIAAHRIHGDHGQKAGGNPAYQGSPGFTSGRLAPEIIADTALDREPGALMDIIGQALAKGLSAETLLVDVLAPAARCLGSRWDNDTADFIDVTMGLWRMQEIVHELAARRPDDLPQGAQVPEIAGGRRILFAVAPGDTHSFGSVMLEEIFLRAGWSARNCRDGNLGDLQKETRAHWFDIVALTISIDQHSAAISELVAALRHASRNPDVRIMVGGKLFLDRPGLAEEVGADATAVDARAALEKADFLVEQAHCERLAFRTTEIPSGLESGSAHALRRSAR